MQVETIKLDPTEFSKNALRALVEVELRELCQTTQTHSYAFGLTLTRLEPFIIHLCINGQVSFAQMMFDATFNAWERARIAAWWGAVCERHGYDVVETIEGEPDVEVEVDD